MLENKVGLVSKLALSAFHGDSEGLSRERAYFKIYRLHFIHITSMTIVLEDTRSITDAGLTDERNAD